MPVYRYKSVAVDINDISRKVPGALTLGNTSSAVYVDITALAGSKSDLDEVMASEGFTYDSQDPANTVGDAAGTQNVAKLTFQQDGAFVGKRSVLNLLNSFTETDNPGNDSVDVVLKFATPVSVGSANAQGASASVARADHVHDHGALAGGSLHSVATGATAGFMSSVDKTKLDGIASGATNTPLATSAPTVIQPDATATIGVSTQAAKADHTHGIVADIAGNITVGATAGEGASTSFSRADHVHSLTAPGAPVDVTKAAASAGVSANVARADHKHDVTTAVVGNIGTANAEGVATSLARSDHTHNLPFTPVQTALAAATGAVSVNGQQITNLGTPTLATDAAPKGYVDSAVQGMKWKAPVRAVAVANVASLSGPQTIDTVPLVAGNRVLLTAQGTASQNGIYDVNAGAWTRSSDMAAGSDGANVTCFVSEGSYQDTAWTCTSNTGSAVVGTDSLAFVQFGTGSIALATLPASNIQPDDAATVGTSVRAAREDHVHGIVAAVAGAIAIGDSAAEGVATSFSRSDHVHSLGAPAAPGTIQPDDTASAGSATAPARADHRHAISADVPVNVDVAANAEGVSTSFARADHKHNISTAAPVAVGNANAAGTSTSLARADHVHKADGAVLTWGNNSVSSTTTTRYMTPGFEDGLATTAAIQFRVPFASKARKLRVRQNSPAGNGNNIVYTLRVNGAASALAATIASTGTDANDLTNEITLAAGDYIDIEVTKASSVGSAPNQVMVTLTLDPL
jgi:hypothetical protein